MLAIPRIILILVMLTSVVSGQAGTASKGGSIRLEKPEVRRRSNTQILSPEYRRIVSILESDFHLELNFSELRDEYEGALKNNHALKFETVITAYIAAEQQSPSSATNDGEAVVRALKPARNNLALALQRVFSLTEEQAKDRAEEAVERYKQAVLQARRH